MSNTESRGGFDNLRQFIQELKLAGDFFDPWGTCMGVWFDVCSHMWWNGQHIPHEWQYSPGMGTDPREEESYWFDLLDATSDEMRLEIGTFLHRYAYILKKHDKDY